MALTSGSAFACTDPSGPTGSTRPITLDLCGILGIGWVAYQNEGGPWTQVTPTSAGTVTIDATEKVSIAAEFGFLGSSFTQIVNATATELEGTGDLACDGTIGDLTMNGTVAGVTGEQVVRISAASGIAGADAGDPSWMLEDLPPQPVDVVATRYATFSSQPSTRVLVRRNVVPANAQVPVLDFNGAEAASVESALVTLTNVPGGMLFASTAVITANNTIHELGELSLAAPASSQGMNYMSLPASLRAATDLHVLNASASSAQANFGITHYYRTPGAKTFAFGPAVGEPTITAAATTPYVRPRVQVAAQAEYPSAMRIQLSESSGEFSSRLVDIVTTAGYFGGTPATWDITVPDMSAAGFDAAAGLQTTSYHWAITAYSWDSPSLLGAAPVEGATTRTSTRGSNEVVAFDKGTRPDRMAFARARTLLLQRLSIR